MQRLKYESSVAICPYHSESIIFLNFTIMCKTKEELYMTLCVCVCVCGKDGDSTQTKLSIRNIPDALFTK
jgi:hypothetical protein